MSLNYLNPNKNKYNAVFLKEITYGFPPCPARLSGLKHKRESNPLVLFGSESPACSLARNREGHRKLGYDQPWIRTKASRCHLSAVVSSVWLKVLFLYFLTKGGLLMKLTTLIDKTRRFDQTGNGWLRESNPLSRQWRNIDPVCLLIQAHWQADPISISHEILASLCRIESITNFPCAERIISYLAGCLYLFDITIIAPLKRT